MNDRERSGAVRIGDPSFALQEKSLVTAQLDALPDGCHGRARVPTTSEKLYAEACHVMPGGVNSPVRAWNAVGGSPLFIQRARGAEVVDADGRSYLDMSARGDR